MKRPDPKHDPEGWKRYWARQVAAAQRETHATVGDGRYARIAYGDDFPDGAPACRDCGVARGQLHVAGCCIEQCPRCQDGQAVGCPCAYGGDLRGDATVH